MSGYFTKIKIFFLKDRFLIDSFLEIFLPKVLLEAVFENENICEQINILKVKKETSEILQFTNLERWQ